MRSCQASLAVVYLRSRKMWSSHTPVAQGGGNGNVNDLCNGPLVVMGACFLRKLALIIHERVRYRNHHRGSFPERRLSSNFAHNGLVTGDGDQRDVTVCRVLGFFTSWPKQEGMPIGVLTRLSISFGAALARCGGILLAGLWIMPP